MDKLPNDPHILFSTVNMLMRDEDFETLDELCYAFGVEKKWLTDKLAAAGYHYSEKEKKFW